MFFRVQNLGPLRDAEVDLSKDLIVLAGPNNSGKTYLAWSVYGLHRFRPEPTKVALDRWVRQLVESPDHAIDLGELFAQPGAEMLDRIAAEYQTKLHLCFAAESTHFATASVSLRSGAPFGESAIAASSHPFAHRDMLLRSELRRGDLDATRLEWEVFDERASIGPVLETAHERMVAAAERHAATTSVVASLSASERKGIDRSLDLQLRQWLQDRLFPACTLFPAERIAVNIFAKELGLKSREILDEMVDAFLDGQTTTPLDLVRDKVGRYPWPIRDSLKTANDLAKLSRDKGPFAPLADEIEAAVLGGDIVISEHGEMLYSPRGMPETRLQMHLTASVVKSLSSLVFYFRYLARRGDFIIIDEPELNLHPDNQRKITRLLGKAVHLGFKVMISTHSDWVIRELSHLVMLSKLPEGEAEKLNYDPQSALPPDKLGVYLFNDHTAVAVPVDETGFSIKTIDDVVNQYNTDDQHFYARILE